MEAFGDARVRPGRVQVGHPLALMEEARAIGGAWCYGSVLLPVKPVWQLLKLFLDLEVDVSVGDNILDDVLIQLAAQSSVGDTGSLEYSN